jgi:putative IMPACT (imprinted ancient) family translation regulator
MSVFKTVKKVGEGLYKEKGSKFLGFAFPCSSEEEAKNKLIQLRKEHHLAVHACYAFRFGADKNQWKKKCLLLLRLIPSLMAVLMRC